MKNHSTTIKKSTLIIGIFLSVLLPFLAIISNLTLKGVAISPEIKFLISRLTQWSALLLLFVFALKIEKRPFLLWKEQNQSFLITIKGIVTVLLLFLASMIVIGILLRVLGVNSESKVLNKTLNVLKNSFPLLIFTSISAGIVEELLFRGYLLPRLEIVFNNKIAAIAISSLMFGLLHFSYATIAQTLGPLAFGVVLAVQYPKYRNIKIVMIAHFLWDLIVLLIKT